MEIGMMNFLIGIIGHCTDQRHLLCYSIFLHEKSNSDFSKLLRLCAISALQTSKHICKNDACVNCGTSNTTTLIWLPRAVGYTMGVYLAVLPFHE